MAWQKNNGKNKKLDIFVGGLLAAAFLSATVIFGHFGHVDVSDGADLGNLLMVFLVAGAVFAVLLFAIYFVCERTEAKSNWKYLARSILVFIGASFAFLIAAYAGVVWGLAYAGLLLSLPFFRERNFADKNANFIALESGLIGGGLIWKLVEFIRGSAIYSILAVEWLVAVIVGIVSGKRVVVFAVVAATAAFLWFTAMMNPCSFGQYLRW